MTAKDISKLSGEAHPMTGGDGPNSYANNSTYQKEVAVAAKELVDKAIVEKLDVKFLLSSSTTFQFADLGCSIGPNTFLSVENILQAVKFKYHSQGWRCSDQILEFQVFFSDHTSNDFNMLFKSLPKNRQYYAAGVPGSFYGRLFPKASIHIFHASYAIHWLSKVPKEVGDRNSPAWNKGRIHYLNSTDEVKRAFEVQYAEDMECFLQARAEEIVRGGLMVFIIPGIPHGIPHSDALANVTYQLLESCLMDMVRKGIVSEEKVDSFNIPMYYMSPQELEGSIEQNGCFSIEMMEILALPNGTVSNALVSASHIRAAMEGMLKQQFGDEVLDELFDLYHKKFEQQHSSTIEAGKAINFLVVLKRN
ncbi:loganic acid O-methyltransferase-like [Rosa rugosa]|uniref:loganic acid O-methyltransferase-like n=1 Tax=Rosa rugosa TaxID=74645 RepID=UPI002B412ED9|nr:loganic acid O-methyltransferase-like [Rosa rugosa]